MNSIIERLKKMRPKAGLIKIISFDEHEALIACLEKAVVALKCNETFHRLGGIDDCEPCKTLTEISNLLNAKEDV